METAQIELRELMRGDNPDQGAINQKIDELSALRGKMQKQRVDTMLAARNVLTPEQRTKIKTFMENRGAGGPGGGRMMERRGGAGAHPGGGAGAKPQTPPAQ
jgi:Spy/CpxP family protein refolding chaperone